MDEGNMSGDDSQTGVTDNAKRLKTTSDGDNNESPSSENNVDAEAASSSANNREFNPFLRRNVKNRNYRKSGQDESSGAER